MRTLCCIGMGNEERERGATHVSHVKHHLTKMVQDLWAMRYNWNMQINHNLLHSWNLVSVFVVGLNNLSIFSTRKPFFFCLFRFRSRSHGEAKISDPTSADKHNYFACEVDISTRHGFFFRRFRLMSRGFITSALKGKSHLKANTRKSRAGIT